MFKRILLLTLSAFFVVSLFVNSEQVFAQENNEEPDAADQTEEIESYNDSTFFSDRQLTTYDNPFWTPEETTFKQGLRYSTLIGVPAIVTAYGFAAWSWGEDDYRFYRERWFESDTDSGGADKTGHFLAHHIVARMCYSVFSYTETSQNRALAYSAFTSFAVGTVIEIGDGFTGNYGFSHEDWIANNLGILTAVLLDKYPVLDEFIGFTGHYWPTKAHKKSGDTLNVPGDYTGWTYLMSFKPAGFKYLGYEIPEYLRFIQFDIGYYTREFTGRDLRAVGGDASQLNPTRNWFFGVSVNMREVARETFKKNRKAAWIAEQPFKYYHLPIGYTSDHEI